MLKNLVFLHVLTEDPVQDHQEPAAIIVEKEIMVKVADVEVEVLNAIMIEDIVRCLHISSSNI